MEHYMILICLLHCSCASLLRRSRKAVVFVFANLNVQSFRCSLTFILDSVFALEGDVRRYIGTRAQSKQLENCFV